MEVLISTCWMSSPSIFGYFLLSRAASPLSVFFFFNDPPTTEIYTLSLHDALPISTVRDEGGDPSATGSDPLISGHGCGGSRPVGGRRRLVCPVGQQPRPADAHVDHRGHVRGRVVSVGPLAHRAQRGGRGAAVSRQLHGDLGVHAEGQADGLA